MPVKSHCCDASFVPECATMPLRAAKKELRRPGIRPDAAASGKELRWSDLVAYFFAVTDNVCSVISPFFVFGTKTFTTPGTLCSKSEATNRMQ